MLDESVRICDGMQNTVQELHMKLLTSCQNWEISVCVQKKKEISVPTCGEISPPFFWLVISQSYRQEGATKAKRQIL